MRLLRLPLADEADDLRKASRFVSVERDALLREAREAALLKDEEAASELLGRS